MLKFDPTFVNVCACRLYCMVWQKRPINKIKTKEGSALVSNYGERNVSTTEPFTIVLP